MNGLQSIPRTHQGEHLAYISPQEAQMLRQQGGGMAPDGGQLQGPGGIPSFSSGADAAAKAAADIAFFQQMLPEYTSVRHLNQSKGSNYAQAGQPGFQGAIMAERMRMDKEAQTPEPAAVERDTSELADEIAGLTAGAQQRGADRMGAMYANLGWGTPPPQFGSATEGGEQFFTEQVTANQMPAYARLRNDPTIIQALGGGSSAPVPTARPDLQRQVQQRAQEIRTASQGGAINRYDLGGLVNNMLLQAGRSRDNIPSNAVS